MHHTLAYLDPTSGSLAFQVAISTFLAAAATARIYWKKLKQGITYVCSRIGRKRVTELERNESETQTAKA